MPRVRPRTRSPRFCPQCGRRMTVTVIPTGWTAHCRPSRGAPPLLWRRRLAEAASNSLREPSFAESATSQNSPLGHREGGRVTGGGSGVVGEHGSDLPAVLEGAEDHATQRVRGRRPAALNVRPSRRRRGPAAARTVRPPQRRSGLCRSFWPDRITDDGRQVGEGADCIERPCGLVKSNTASALPETDHPNSWTVR